MSVLDFMKLEGCGNSLVVVFDSGQEKRDWAEISRFVCNPNFGIGADGLMLVGPSKQSQFDVDMFNPDGSQAGMCGNGLRCVVRYLILTGKIDQSAEEISFQVGQGKSARVVECHISEQGRFVTVNMGKPEFMPSRIPMRWTGEEFVNKALGTEAWLASLRGTAVSMGNPHVVIFVPSLSDIDWKALGPRLEHHELFPERVNVEFAEVRSPDDVLLRVWERGAGPTLACGSGACATVAAGVRLGLLRGEHCKIELPGGVLKVAWDNEGADIYMSGPAREICRGEVYLPGVV